MGPCLSCIISCLEVHRLLQLLGPERCLGRSIGPLGSATQRPPPGHTQRSIVDRWHGGLFQSGSPEASSRLVKTPQSPIRWGEPGSLTSQHSVVKMGYGENDQHSIMSARKDDSDADGADSLKDFSSAMNYLLFNNVLKLLHLMLHLKDVFSSKQKLWEHRRFRNKRCRC